MGRKKDHFSIFSVSFSFFGKELENERKLKSPSFYPHFYFFLLLFFRFSDFFFLLFSLFSCLGNGNEGEMGVRVYSIFFPLFFFLREKNGRINWKNSKEIRLLFLLNFLSSFRFFSLLFFSFWERKWRGKGQTER